jgi:hypothetical protein
MIHFTLRDQDRSFCCQVIGNIMLSKCFDEMRLLRPLRSLRLLRSLRPLRLLMPGKSLNMPSASFHSQQKGINEPKTLKKKFESTFTLGTFKLSFANIFCTHSALRLWRTGMLFSTKSKDHKSKFRISWMCRSCFYDLKVHFWWPNKCLVSLRSSWNTLYMP